MFKSRNKIITKKLGVVQIYTNNGEILPVTLISLCKNIVIDRNIKNTYFNILKIGAYNHKLKKKNQDSVQLFYKNHIFPKKNIFQSATEKEYELSIGDRIGVDFFRRNQYIDVIGITIGKGFAGVIKRHKFKGLEATHGVSISHRAHGSTGQCQDPGRVLKGKKMAGHLGNRKSTVKNLRIIDIDYDLGILIIKGIIPGFNNGYIYVKDSSKTKIPFESK